MLSCFTRSGGVGWCGMTEGTIRCLQMARCLTTNPPSSVHLPPLPFKPFLRNNIPWVEDNSGYRIGYLLSRFLVHRCETNMLWSLVVGWWVGEWVDHTHLKYFNRKICRGLSRKKYKIHRHFSLPYSLFKEFIVTFAESHALFHHPLVSGHRLCFGLRHVTVRVCGTVWPLNTNIQFLQQ